MAQKTVDELEGSSQASAAQRITVVAGPGATPFLDYLVPVLGVDVDDDLDFLIECELPEPTSRLPQEEYCTINTVNAEIFAGN